jgi:NAD(P)-dependent dehydrogenase (short-subunit alcohol dehydrogenase family)
MPDGRLQGKVAIVTGGAGGIGRAIAERYAAEGASVVVADIDGHAAEAVAGPLESALAVACDVSSRADCDRLFAATLERFTKLDILVNNAALTATERHFLEADDEWWDSIIAVNLTGSYNTAVRAAKLMAAQRSGVMINLSSGGASKAHRGNAAYDAAKGGIEALTRALALDLGPYGVRVCTLVPGSIDTKGLSEDERRKRGINVPLSRVGTPEDMAGPAVFLASDDAQYVTGSIVFSDGGMLAQQRSATVDIFGLEKFPGL